jgi:hypothetical protein
VVRELVLESAGLQIPVGAAVDVTESATVARGEWKHFGPYHTAAGDITVEMTGSGDADLYVRMGGQPSLSLYDCRPYGGDSNESCTASGPGALYVSVYGYAAATVSVRIRYTGAGAPDAGVRPDAGGVVDAGRPDAGNVVDAGRPDAGSGVVDAGTIVDAGTPPPPGPQPLPVDAPLSATLAAGAWKHYGPFQLPASGTVTIQMTGTGDGDLYVRKGAQPTASAYDCRPYAGNSNESCTVSGPGTLYVSVHAYTAATVTIRFSVGTAPTSTHLNVSGSVAVNELKVYTVPVTAGRAIVVRTQAANDVDLYLQVGSAPTTSSYVARGYTASGNEAVTYNPTTNGTLYVGVHGYAASSFTLTTADQ